MSAVKQIFLSVLVLALAGAGWWAYTNRDVLLAQLNTSTGSTGSEPAATGGAPRPAGGANVAAAPPQGGGAPAAGPGPGPAGGGFGGGGFGGGGFGGAAPAPSSGGNSRAISVIAEPVVMETIGDELRSLGSASAARAITIFPPASGMVDEIRVRPGAEVAEGDVILTLENADQEIAVERARLALEAADAALARAERLAAGQNITEVALSDARNAAARAEIDLRSAEVALARRQATAPFSGVVGLITVTVGDIVSTSTAITTLDDMSSLRVTFEVPARFSGRLLPGHAVVATSESVIEPMSGVVTAVDSRIDETTRTFRVEASLDSGIEGLRPGMAVNATVSFPGQERPTVSSLAVLWDSQGSYVWKVDGNRARRTPVQIVSRRSGSVVLAANLSAGDQVIVEGYQRLRDGSQVTIAAPPGSPTPTASNAPAASRPAPTAAPAVASAPTAPASGPGVASPTPNGAPGALPGGGPGRLAAAIPQEVAELIRQGSPIPAEVIAQLREAGQLPAGLIDRLARGETLPPEVVQRLLGAGVATGAPPPDAGPAIFGGGGGGVPGDGGGG